MAGQSGLDGKTNAKAARSRLDGRYPSPTRCSVWVRQSRLNEALRGARPRPAVQGMPPAGDQVNLWRSLVTYELGETSVGKSESNGVHESNGILDSMLQRHQLREWKLSGQTMSSRIEFIK